MRTFFWLIILPVVASFWGCSSSREFWQYVVDGKVAKPITRESGERDTPRPLSPYNVKVVYNDGSQFTEVIIPILASGQQIVIDHDAKVAPQALQLVPLPPTNADAGLEDAYVKQGNPVNDKAAPVSIVNTHERIRQLAKEGNYGLALLYAEQLLARYPNHVTTLKAKGSLLLKMGEKDAALKTYYRANEMEPDKRVEEIIKELEGETN